MARTDQPFVSVNCQIQQVASILDKQECAKRILSEINLRSQVLLHNVTPSPINSYSHSRLSGKLTCSCQPAPWSTCQLHFTYLPANLLIWTLGRLNLSLSERMFKMFRMFGMSLQWLQVSAVAIDKNYKITDQSGISLTGLD